MSEPHPHRRDVERARSFDLVADAYDRARPSYPVRAVEWLVGPDAGRVLELGAGTGKLTGQLLRLAPSVVATDPSGQMLQRLRTRLPAATVARAQAEAIPVASGSVDVVVSAQAFHWFDPERALPEISRVLGPEGVLALVWNQRDERIPWVKRLGSLLGRSVNHDEVVSALDASGLFEQVETSTFRFWQPLSKESLRDLVLSRSNVAVLSDLERERVLRKADALYDDYGRGADGMLLPYVTHTFRARVRPRVEVLGKGSAVYSHEMDTDALLIDFR